MRIGSLCSGIGGLDLGLELAGVGETVWQVERDDFCRRVLRKHWPNAEQFDDLHTVGAHNLSRVDVICGGTPCQDISYAGKGEGLEGSRSGLYWEFHRIVRELRPRYVVWENVGAALTRGIDRVLGSLAELGYDAEWHCLRASDVGAPHRRERLFVIAWLADTCGEQPECGRVGRELPCSQGSSDRQGYQWQRHGDAARDGGEAVADTDGSRRGGEAEPWRLQAQQSRPARSSELANTASSRSQGSAVGAHEGWTRSEQRCVGVGQADANVRGREGLGLVGILDGVWPPHGYHADGCRGAPTEGDRDAQSRLGPHVDGVSRRMAGRWPARPGEAQHSWEAPRVRKFSPRSAESKHNKLALKDLGNAVVPAQGEVIGLRLMEIARGR